MSASEFTYIPKYSIGCFSRHLLVSDLIAFLDRARNAFLAVCYVCHLFISSVKWSCGLLPMLRLESELQIIAQLKSHFLKQDNEK